MRCQNNDEIGVLRAVLHTPGTAADCLSKSAVVGRYATSIRRADVFTFGRGGSRAERRSDAGHLRRCAVRWELNISHWSPSPRRQAAAWNSSVDASPINGVRSRYIEAVI